MAAYVPLVPIGNGKRSFFQYTCAMPPYLKIGYTGFSFEYLQSKRTDSESFRWLKQQYHKYHRLL